MITSRKGWEALPRLLLQKTLQFLRCVLHKIETQYPISKTGVGILTSAGKEKKKKKKKRKKRKKKKKTTYRHLPPPSPADRPRDAADPEHDHPRFLALRCRKQRPEGVFQSLGVQAYPLFCSVQEAHWVREENSFFVFFFVEMFFDFQKCI
jgi:hypothetical protein